MAFVIQALSDKVICKVIKQEAISPGGLILPDSDHSSIQPKKNLIVVSVGDEIENVDVGDEVICHERAGMDHMMDDGIYKIVKYEELYGVIKGNNNGSK